ncbi:uncharacterized protein I206_100664 [Kwoniella pini CBS 10737]|uniref:Uncharacterized protein n=1 Tax=Kwoniella pini CBS 10737 TaxID=1296096 RepID=A0A1B9ICK2_9TREE|nr:uncharacterized protein I206_00661 [Kwoniella pini CBS 10737]OCF53359.1 hypothetical protein I206_00661 [Kwoniella pini CBS 10737]
MSQTVPAPIVKEAELETVRRWLNARPDILLAIAKRHTTNPLLSPLPSSSSSSSIAPTLILSVPIDGLSVDKIRIKAATKARNIEVDIPLPDEKIQGLGKGGFGKRIEKLGNESLEYFQVPQHPKIEYYEPPTSVSVLPIYPLLLLLFLVFAPKDHGIANMGRNLVNNYLGKWVIPSATWFAAACHLVIEPLIIIPKLRQHQVPSLQSFLYVATVVCIGYGPIDALNRAVIQERMKLVQAHSSEGRKAQ